ncbi:MAG: hypothetical protein V4519_00940 [Patescibacteria group bacterium]
MKSGNPQVRLIGTGFTGDQREWYLQAPEGARRLGEDIAGDFLAKFGVHGGKAEFKDDTSLVLSLPVTAQHKVETDADDFVRVFGDKQPGAPTYFKMRSGPCKVVAMYEIPDRVLSNATKLGMLPHFKSRLEGIGDSEFSCILRIEVKVETNETVVTILDMGQMGFGHVKLSGVDVPTILRGFDVMVRHVEKLPTQFPLSEE